MKENLRKKAFAIMESIEKMSVHEKSRKPSEAFGRDYNKMWDLVLLHDPGLEKFMPPRAKIDREDGPGLVVAQTFAELHAYCTQMYHLLS